MPVALSKTYSKIEDIESDREAHKYYVRKFMEGFNKLDKNFLCSFSKYLEPLIKENFSDKLFYEKKVATKRTDTVRLQTITRYSRKEFNLLIKVFEKNRLVKSCSIYKCEPDMFIAKYHVNKVEITDVDIIVTNKVQESTLELKIEEII